MRRLEGETDLKTRLRTQLPALEGRPFLHVPQLLVPWRCDVLASQTEELSWEALPPVVGKVRQDADMSASALASAPTAIKQLGSDLREAIAPWLCRRAGPQAALWPNEAAALRYPHRGGITAHRDIARYKFLIVIASISGTAVIEFFGEQRRVVETRAGDLLVLLGSGAGERPRHAVTITSEQGRLSITYRYDADLPNFDQRG